MVQETQRTFKIQDLNEKYFFYRKEQNRKAPIVTHS